MNPLTPTIPMDFSRRIVGIRSAEGPGYGNCHVLEKGEVTQYEMSFELMECEPELLDIPGRRCALAAHSDLAPIDGVYRSHHHSLRHNPPLYRPRRPKQVENPQ